MIGAGAVFNMQPGHLEPEFDGVRRHSAATTFGFLECLFPSFRHDNTPFVSQGFYYPECYPIFLKPRGHQFEISAINAYDKPGTIFFLDPPYYKAPYYAHNFKINDFEELAEPLADIRSDFVFSINDHPVMRKVFDRLKIRPVKLSYSAAQGECVKAQELLITK